MSRIIDLSPRVPQGFMGPPSTNIGVQFEVRTKRSGSSYWQSGQVFMSLHTGCHVETALHCFENGEPIDQVSLERVIGSAVVLDLAPVAERALIDVADLERAYERLAAQQETIKAGDIILLRTDWAQRAIGTPVYFPQSPGLTEKRRALAGGEAAQVYRLRLLRGTSGQGPWMDGRPVRRSPGHPRCEHSAGRRPGQPGPIATSLPVLCAILPLRRH